MFSCTTQCHKCSKWILKDPIFEDFYSCPAIGCGYICCFDCLHVSICPNPHCARPWEISTKNMHVGHDLDEIVRQFLAEIESARIPETKERLLEFEQHEKLKKFILGLPETTAVGDLHRLEKIRDALGAKLKKYLAGVDDIVLAYSYSKIRPRLDDNKIQVLWSTPERSWIWDIYRKYVNAHVYLRDCDELTWTEERVRALHRARIHFVLNNSTRDEWLQQIYKIESIHQDRLRILTENQETYSKTMFHLLEIAAEVSKVRLNEIKSEYIQESYGIYLPPEYS